MEGTTGKCPVTAALGWYDCAVKKINMLQPVFMLLLRLYIGYEAAISGWAHLTNVDKTAEFFASLHIPMPRLNVYIAGGTELVGGILIALGIFSRLVAIPFTFNFLIAILSVNLAYPKMREQLANILSNQDVILKDDAFPFFFVGLLIIIFGAGKISVDHLIIRPLLTRKHAAPLTSIG